MKTEGNPRIFIVIIVAVIGLALGIWQKNANGAEASKAVTSPIAMKVPQCFMLDIALIERGEGTAKGEALKRVRSGAEKLYDTGGVKFTQDPSSETNRVLVGDMEYAYRLTPSEAKKMVSEGKRKACDSLMLGIAEM